MFSNETIRSYVEANWDAIEQDIADMVAIASTEDLPGACDGAPFGKEVRRATDKILEIANRLGFKTYETDGYYGIAELQGKDDQQLAIVAHVDVVPAGPGWATDPFEMVKKEGYLLGRGVEDDKGPAVIALWAAHYFIENNIVPEHTIRFVFGTNEETGMGGVKKYVKDYPQPDFMFTPDAEFPVIAGEKGIIHGAISFALPQGSTITKLNAGVAPNAVAGEAEAHIKSCCGELEDTDRVKVTQSEDGKLCIHADGISGHASMPEGTINAIKVLMDYLVANNLIADCDKPWVGFVNKLMADAYGRALGIDCAEEFLGELTCVGGMLNLEDGIVSQSIDIRYPGATTEEELCQTLQGYAQEFGGKFEAGHTEHSHLVEPDDPKVQALIASYSNVVGKKAEPIAIGGGTYAKRFERSVAFGPCEMDCVKPEWAGNMHGPNEAVEVAQLKDALIIYVEGIENLMQLDLRA